MRQLAEKLGIARRKSIEPWLPSGIRIYCVGDIHGRDDLLLDLCTRIRSDAGGFAGNKVVVFLGDYIDRGPDSRAVVDRLIADPLPDFRKVFLRGNHEQAMLDFMEEPGIGEMWLTFGGHTTLTSYGVVFDRLPTRPTDFMRLGDSLRTAVPFEHCTFLRETHLCYTVGNYFFCHAGVRPGVPLGKQQPEDLLWIREEFTEYRRNHEKIVVHGHTISTEVKLLPNRIGLDTGAYETGVLSCLVLEDTGQRVIQT